MQDLGIGTLLVLVEPSSPGERAAAELAFPPLEAL